MRIYFAALWVAGCGGSEFGASPSSEGGADAQAPVHVSPMTNTDAPQTTMIPPGLPSADQSSPPVLPEVDAAVDVPPDVHTEPSCEPLDTPCDPFTHDCCSGRCTSVLLVCAPCIGSGGTCNWDGDCCSGLRCRPDRSCGP